LFVFLFCVGLLCLHPSFPTRRSSDLAKLNPDILCLQETKCHTEQLTQEMINPFDYQSHWSCAVRKGYSGVATFHKDEIKSSQVRSEEHTSELQSRENLVCRLLLEKKK